ncbi:MAG TPA: hypothetical protein VGK59_12125 [Ohtaekwangia sp.]
MNVRKINPEEIVSVHFPHADVLHNNQEKDERDVKLHKAVALSNIEHQDIGIVLQLDTGEIIETYSPLVDYADDFVIIKGGYFIPVWAIVDVEA